VHASHLPKTRTKRKSRVTIIIGIICKDAIVLASDSQTTSGGMKRTDTDKISSIKFATKPVLVAEAGNAGTSARALEILRGLARDIPIDDYRVPADQVDCGAGADGHGQNGQVRAPSSGSEPRPTPSRKSPRAMRPARIPIYGDPDGAWHPCLDLAST
jgi:hypothetical protein